MAVNLLLTGPPGCGKTTIIRKVEEALPVEVVGGFVTSELRKGGRRVGFEVQVIHGPRAVLAHVDIRSPYRVGRYGIDLAAFEATGVAALAEAVARESLIVIDEIGRMELFSKRFVHEVYRALDSPSVVLATISARSHPICDLIKARPDVELWLASRENRDGLPAELLARIEAIGPGSTPKRS